jgi:nucleotide-binding universal stress UspA family protein
MTGQSRADGGEQLHLAGTVVVPVAETDDARATGRALAGHLADGAGVLAVNVVEKAGGAPDRASVEQREALAEDAFDAFRAALEEGVAVETRVLYDTDVAAAVFDAAADVDATAIAFTPRGGSRWVRLLTGDVALDLVTGSDRPVVVLPDETGEGDA